jgi:PAS domain S-box-containing protein
VKHRQRDLPVFAYALTLTVLIGGGVLGHLNARRLIANDRTVAHTNQAILELANVLSTLKDAETGQRGYLLAENDAYLQPYQEATARLQSELASLKDELVAEPDQQARLADLERTVALKLSELDRTITLHKTGDRAAALALVRSDNGKRYMDEVRAQIAAMQTTEYELLNRRANESERSSRTTIISIVLAAVIGCALLAIVFSLTRRNLLLRQRATDELSAERERLRVTLTSIGDAVLTTDSSGRITFVNPVAEVLTGWSQPEVLGQPLDTVFRIVNEHTRESVENPAQRSLREGVVVGLANHTVLIRKDGTEHPIDDSAAPIRDGQGRILGCVLVFRDVTQRRHEEQRRAEDEARIRSVMDHVADGILTFDEDGTVETFNPAAERLFGYTAEEIMGQNVKLVLPDPFHSAHRKYGADGEAQIIDAGHEIDGRRKDGSTFPLEAAVSEFSLGSRRYFTGIVRDITHRKRIERQMYEMMTELKEGDRRKDEFLAMLAHELRGPLTALRNGLELLTRTDGNPDLLRRVRGATQRQLSQLVRLVNDLLDVSRITSNKIDLRREPVELAGVIQQAIDECERLAESARQRINVSLPPEPIYVDADPARLAQVFSNILHNACKYTDPGGAIEVAAALQGDQVVVKFKDTGIGIPSNKLDSIFELFMQVDRTLERSQDGLGIGLSLVKRLVDMHGGSVEAFSEGLGHGSEFVVRLPVPAGRGVETAESTTEPAGPSRRILIVDDNTDSAASLAMLLQLSNHETYTAHDGLQALESVERLQPDVVLLDVGLPKLNGYEVCRRIRQQPWAKNVLIVAITGWGQAEDQKKSNEAGFDAHMVKPPDYDALMRLFSSHLPIRGQAQPESGLT